MVYRLVVSPEQIQADRISLTDRQLHYLLRVLRLQNGDRFIAFDGEGNAWLARISQRSAQIIESIKIETELPVTLNLLTALPKSSGYESIVRCCTELGVSNFIPVISDRTILKPSSNKVQRWRKIAIEAAEQSERQIVPSILEPVKFRLAIAKTELNSDKYICVARGELPTLWTALQNSTRPTITIATGCEGGWTDAEVEQAIACGFQPVSLGNRILRSVTAPIVASSLAMATLTEIERLNCSEGN